MRRVERDIGLSGFQDAEHAGDHRRVVRKQQRDSGFTIANEFENHMGDLVGSRVQFRVGPFVIRGLDGDPRGIFSDLSFKAFRNRLFDF